MFSGPKGEGLQWLLGKEQEQRVNLSFWLNVSSLYLLLLLALFVVAYVGLADMRKVLLLSALCVVSLIALYVALRSGWSKKRKDPALTEAQMVGSLIFVSMAYWINPYGFSTAMMLIAFILMFGAFTLSDAHCRRMGWIGVGIISFTMILGTATEPDLFPLSLIVFNLIPLLIVLPSVARMAGRLSTIRMQLRAQKKELEATMDRLNRVATEDELTGLPNRRRALEALAHEERRSARQPKSPCVAILDIDHFKKINDTLGHAAGDLVLKIFAKTCTAALRDTDLLARWGGEEFMLLMPDTPPVDAALVLQRLHDALANPAVWKVAPECKVTFSAGYTEHVPGESMETSLARADAALYRAKDEGRNRSMSS